MKVKKKLLENYLEAIKSYDIHKLNETIEAIGNPHVTFVLYIAIDLGVTDVDAIAETLRTLDIEVVE